MKNSVVVVLFSLSSLPVATTGASPAATFVGRPSLDTALAGTALADTAFGAAAHGDHTRANEHGADSGRVVPPIDVITGPPVVSVGLFPARRLVAFQPPVSLAQAYSADVDVSDYLVSEKYDGARVWWTGQHLLSRNGNPFNAPAWFTDALPDCVLDGELWIGRGKFQQLMKTIRDQRPDEQAWRSVRFMVFDAPQSHGGFEQRQLELKKILNEHHPKWLTQVVQHRVANAAELQQRLSDIVAQGGEGLMLQRANMSYFAGRHSGFLKLKRFEDDEAVVTGYKPGKGKYTGMVGSLIVRDAAGRQFKLGSGLTDIDRKVPPPIGAIVTYRFQGRTESGKPRFARYLRVRLED